MSDKEDKPAFPVTNVNEPGLTKREYFVAKAMQAYASSRAYECSSYNTIAEYAVQLADRVLEELEKKK